MEETVVTDANFLQVLLTSPLTYIVLAIIGLTIYQLTKGKSSTKCCGSNKTSTPSTPKRARSKGGKFVADDPKTPQNEAWVGGKAPKKKPTKKTSAKKTPAKRKATKKAVIKRTPKKSGK
tara:strand:- start:152 stop:511 length:360 start_codon:yes stop_codon:yes gene_type:complete